jgi:hypothetical protein
MTSVHFDPEGSLEGLTKACGDAMAGGARGLHILASSANDWLVSEANQRLSALEVPMFGGLFPGLLHQGRTYDRGTLVIGHADTPRVVTVPLEADGASSSRSWASGLRESGTLFAYLDATCNAGVLTTALFEEFGVGIATLGGGAGALDFKRRPVVIADGALREGVAVLAGLPHPTHVGIAHGWRPIGEPILITEAVGNEIVSLAWRPALDAYRDVVEAHSGKTLALDHFYDHASHYPFILERLGAEGVVRDPISVVAGGHLLCAGDVQPNATVRVANGSVESMLEAARLARQMALQRAGQRTPALNFVIDCISRALILKDRLGEELAALAIAGCPQVGALTIGEVANSGESFTLFHNKSTVVGLLEGSRATG